MDLQAFLGLLRGVVRSGQGHKALCPAHDDRQASLSVRAGDRAILIKCHAGCQREAVLTALHLRPRDLFYDNRPRGSGPARTIAATYPYTDEAGAVLFEVVRFNPKDFRQRRPDPDRTGEWLWNLQGTRLVPYHLDDLALLHPARVVIVEGEKDADRLWALGIPATTNAMGAGKWRPEYTEALKQVGVRQVILVPDHDDPGRSHMRDVGQSTTAAGIEGHWLDLPNVPARGDVSDWLNNGGSGPALEALLAAAPAYPPRVTLADVHSVFHRWLGDEYDAEVLDIVLAAAASHWLGGDPCWLIVVSGSGAAKTETVQSLEGAGATVVSVIASQGALLSATGHRERSADATGGLLRQIGDTGLLVIKDLTSMLSMDRTTRAGVLAALREIHDGKWVRQVGTDGGRQLSWAGRVTLVGASTGVWDRHHEVIATMGDRFLLVRFDSRYGREAAFRQARENTGHEREMREALSAVVAALFASINPAGQVVLAPDDETRLFRLADTLALLRTPVETDYREDVVFAHAPEMPTRVGKQLYQLIRGAMALGLSMDDAMALAVRCARDTTPPLRLALMEDLALQPQSRVGDVRRRTSIPYMTVKRHLEALEAMHLVTKEVSGDDDTGRATYSVSSAVTLDVFGPNRASTSDDSKVPF